MDPERTQITDLLLKLRQGDSADLDRLLGAVYPELRRLAHIQLLGERPGHTLGTTGLVHETYFRLVDQERVEWKDRGQFFGVAALAMRRILVDYARRHLAQRRGGGEEPLTLEHEMVASERSEELVALDEALARLAELSPRMSQVVECRYFGGLTEDETAEALGISKRSVQREWAKARGWLYLELRG
jgi:RNA polymerase sigma factor (TIGR02999 family)